jgi:hypothetical protein
LTLRLAPSDRRERLEARDRGEDVHGLSYRLPARAAPPPASTTATGCSPGHRPGQHLHATRLAQRLRALGVDPRADRNTALLQLGAEVPPAVLADLLGFHIGTAINWANEAGGDWTNYAAIRATAHIGSHSVG